MQFDVNGKVSFDHIYTQPDPRAYFSTLRKFDYCIPQLAKPYFDRLLREYRESQRIQHPKILDVGCSYGINAALLKCDVTMDELYERYCGPDSLSQTHNTLVSRDRQWMRSRRRLKSVRFIGLDVSEPALSYALSAGFLDGAVHADLESSDPTERQRELFAGTDLVVSTGCLGYVTGKTLSRVVGANGERKPWMAHFVLRMFPFDSLAEGLAAHGYETVHLDRVFKQRRFASPEERDQILDTLSTVGVDPCGLEADGWLYAQLYVSRPRGTKGRVVVDLSSIKESAGSPNHRGKDEIEH